MDISLKIGNNVLASRAGRRRGAITRRRSCCVISGSWRREHPAHRYREEIEENRADRPQFEDDSVPMNLQRPEIRDLLPRDRSLRAKREHLMDIAAPSCRTSNEARLDASSFGTMGVGPSSAIAARAVHPQAGWSPSRVTPRSVSVAEVEVAAGMAPITFIILNNNGISGGASS
jgi:thiamine pyrophosphate-dependent acetolactate synthase large subunit-like protein